MKKIGKITLSALALALTLCITFPPIASAKRVKKVDNILILVDTSGSMSERHSNLNQKKIDAAVDMISRFDKAVPELGYTTGVFTVAPFEVISPLQTYQNGVLSSAAGDVDTGFGLLGRLTPIGSGMKEAGVKNEGLSGKTAVILFTDGDSNVGADPVAAAQALYDRFSPDVCIHIVSLADNKSGRRTIDRIRSLSDCSVSANGNSLATNAGMAAFAGNVLYEKVPDTAPAPAMGQEVITFNLLFGFDKADIMDDMIPVLEQVQMILEEDPNAEFIVAGHTDSVGTDEYNQGLSERRAAGVGNWLTGNGIDTYRLEVVGYGESLPKFDNSTEEGRKLNRRVEILTK